MKAETIDAVLYLVSVRVQESANHFLYCSNQWGEDDEMTKCALRELNRWEDVRNDLLWPPND